VLTMYKRGEKGGEKNKLLRGYVIDIARGGLSVCGKTSKDAKAGGKGPLLNKGRKLGGGRAGKYRHGRVSI